MKKNLCFALIAAAIQLASCNSKTDISGEMPGAYFMTEQIIRNADDKTSYKDLKQLKIYTGTHFMFTQINPRDSSVSFGVGSYTMHGDTLREQSQYASRDATFDKEPKTYNLLIEVTPESYNQAAGYSQRINDFMIHDKPFTLVEYYAKGKDTVVSPLDGVWKEIRSYAVVAGDTLTSERVQYKAFYRGYFMFGNTVKTGTDSTFTGMGYGTFKIKSDSEIEETDLHSSYPFVAGNTFTVRFEKPDDDHFTQTITHDDGSISVEYYERLK